MAQQEGSAQRRMAAAADHCKDHIKWYEANKRKSMWLYAVFQTSVVVLSGLTPVLILWSRSQKPSRHYRQLLRPLPLLSLARLGGETTRHDSRPQARR